MLILPILPLYLSLNAFIEEGIRSALLERIVATLAETANAVGVRVVAGDTYDPLYLACEGRVAEAQAEDLLTQWRRLPEGAEAALIGGVEERSPRVLWSLNWVANACSMNWKTTHCQGSVDARPMDEAA